MNRNEELYRLLIEWLPNLAKWGQKAWNEEVPMALKFKAGGYMDLSVDLLDWRNSSFRIALSHHYKHPSGDMIPDPDMEIEIDTATKTARAMTFQNEFVYNSLDQGGADVSKLSQSMDSFLANWVRNIQEQGFEPVQQTQNQAHEIS